MDFFKNIPQKREFLRKMGPWEKKLSFGHAFLRNYQVTWHLSPISQFILGMFPSIILLPSRHRVDSVNHWHWWKIILWISSLNSIKGSRLTSNQFFSIAYSTQRIIQFGVKEKESSKQNWKENRLTCDHHHQLRAEWEDKKENKTAKDL